MASSTPLTLLHMPFLHPSRLPRPATFRHFFHTTPVARGETHSARIARRDGTPLKVREGAYISPTPSHLLPF